MDELDGLDQVRFVYDFLQDANEDWGTEDGLKGGVTILQGSSAFQAPTC